MKTLIAILLLLNFWSTAPDIEVPGPTDLYGAWESNKPSDGKQVKTVTIFTPKYFISSTYTEGEYKSACGGTWTMNAEHIELNYEFHTVDPDKVGTSEKSAWKGQKDKMDMEWNGEKRQWKQLDDGKSELAGAWRITGRKRDGVISKNTLGPRKTFKILSGTRFQWAAYNVDTKQFSGSGGGSYTLKEGKYTEHIEVFSRDNSRVGASLEFSYEIQGDDWHHSGLSSKGDPIYEIWTNQDK